jgi:2-dehydro-3-deoxyphosphogluconate aldolase/(4S)-4-hydroxy-2-oxoglutarate aldolase
LSEQSILELICQRRLVAIVRLDDLQFATQLSSALLQGGVVLQEFTLTNPQAVEALERVRHDQPMFDGIRAAVGVGSVRTRAEAQMAIDSGAQYVVTPTLNESVIDQCLIANVPIMCGAFTPTEIVRAWELGASIVKVFPARVLGPNFIKDVLAPLPELKLMPTGGIDLHNIKDYFASGAHAVGVGGNLVNATLVASQEWEKIQVIARQYAQAASCELPT